MLEIVTVYVLAGIVSMPSLGDSTQPPSVQFVDRAQCVQAAAEIKAAIKYSGLMCIEAKVYMPVLVPKAKSVR